LAKRAPLTLESGGEQGLVDRQSTPRAGASLSAVAVTIYGVCALSFMMIMYALERRGVGFVLAFAFGCLLSSAYGFLSGAWPFGVVECIWAGIAVHRYRGLLVGNATG
jgi:hypothetical protein